MFGKIFSIILSFCLLLPTVAHGSDDFYIKFDTGTVKLSVGKCHFWSTISKCVYLRDKDLPKNPKRIIKTNLPQMKWYRIKDAYYAKVQRC